MMREIFKCALQTCCCAMVIFALTNCSSSTDDPTTNTLDTSGDGQNTAVTKAVNFQQSPQLATDAAGGAIIVWSDYRNGNADIYAQKMTATQEIGWSATDVPICSATGNQVSPKIVSDGAGGAVIIWSDYRSGNADIYAQRVDNDGVAQWTADGVVIVDEPNTQLCHQLIADGSGGAIIVWEDNRSGNNDIYAQRLDATGAVFTGWDVNGKVISDDIADQSAPQLISDGADGAIIVWEDERNGNTDIYALRIDDAGEMISGWIANGAEVCVAANVQRAPQLISDGASGAIIVWEDERNDDTDADIYAQRIDDTGAGQWTHLDVNDNAIPAIAISVATNIQRHPRVVTDGTGGAFITWEDKRLGVLDIYGQHIISDGTVRWTNDGSALCAVGGEQSEHDLVAAATGEAISVWKDNRSGAFDIYGLRFGDNADKNNINSIWTAGGVIISNASSHQWHPAVIPGANEESIVVFEDYRDVELNIYGQIMAADGAKK